MPDNNQDNKEKKLNLSGAQMSAVLLMLIGKERAVQVLKHLNPKEIQLLGQTMTDVEDVTHETISAIAREFINEIGQDALKVDPQSYARDLMQDALGEGGGHMMDAHMLADKISGIEALKWMSKGKSNPPKFGHRPVWSTNVRPRRNA